MKKLILFTLFSLCIALQASAWNPMIMTSGSSAAAIDYSDITLWVNFLNGPTSGSANYTILEGTTEHSAGDTTLLLSAGAVVSTTAKKDSNYGLYGVGAYDYGSLVPNAGDIISDDEGRFGTWLRIQTWVVNALILTTQTDASNQIRLTIVGGSDSDIEFKSDYIYGGTSVTKTSTTFNGVENTWYFVETAWKQGAAGSGYLDVLVDGVSIISDTTGTLGDMTGTINLLRVGENSDTASNLYFARILVSSDSTRDLDALSDIINYPGN